MLSYDPTQLMVSGLKFALEPPRIMHGEQLGASVSLRPFFEPRPDYRCRMR